MAFDTPARIAIIGAGPIGLEAALYARFLGYQTDIYEQGDDVCEHVRRWGHVRLFTPFKLNRSTLGLAALAAQDPDYVAPQDEEILSGHQWRDRYLRPLSNTDLLVDSLRFNSRVISISRPECPKNEPEENLQDAENGFSILVQTPGAESRREADIVIDTSGVFSQPNFLGHDVLGHDVLKPRGAPAFGELALRNDAAANRSGEGHIEYGIPDVDGADRARFADRSTLVIGSGHSAATTVCGLAGLFSDNAAHRVTWICRQATRDQRPIREIADDPLPQRSSLATQANDLAAAHAGQGPKWLRFFDETSVREIAYDQATGKYAVQFSGKLAGEIDGPVEFDNVVANVGYRPDLDMLRGLQVQFCPVTEAPINLATQLIGETSADCLKQTTHGAETLITCEPNFYVLGSKSYGRHHNFLYTIGLGQIRELFSLIGDRATLDLYAPPARLSNDATS